MPKYLYTEQSITGGLHSYREANPNIPLVQAPFFDPGVNIEWMRARVAFSPNYVTSLPTFNIDFFNFALNAHVKDATALSKSGSTCGIRFRLESSQSYGSSSTQQVFIRELVTSSLQAVFYTYTPSASAKYSVDHALQQNVIQLGKSKVEVYDATRFLTGKPVDLVTRMSIQSGTLRADYWAGNPLTGWEISGSDNGATILAGGATAITQSGNQTLQLNLEFNRGFYMNYDIQQETTWEKFFQLEIINGDTNPDPFGILTQNTASYVIPLVTNGLYRGTDFSEFNDQIDFVERTRLQGNLQPSYSLYDGGPLRKTLFDIYYSAVNFYFIDATGSYRTYPSSAFVNFGWLDPDSTWYTLRDTADDYKYAIIPLVNGGDASLTLTPFAPQPQFQLVYQENGLPVSQSELGQLVASNFNGYGPPKLLLVDYSQSGYPTTASFNSPPNGAVLWPTPVLTHDLKLHSASIPGTSQSASIFVPDPSIGADKIYFNYGVVGFLPSWPTKSIFD